MIQAELTEDQLIELKSEFVDFKINEMTNEELADYVRAMMLLEIDPDPEILKDEIDSYDDNLYDVLVPYVLDQEGSWEVMQEFLHDRQEQWSGKYS